MPFKMGNKVNLGRKQTPEHIENAKRPKIGRKRPEHSLLMRELARKGTFKIIGKKTKEDKLRQSKIMKKWIKENGHPKGMLGKNHSEETKELNRVISKEMWANPKSKVNSRENKQRQSNLMSKRHLTGEIRTSYSRGRMGTYDINGKKIFFRSLWEVNYALYLDYLIKIKQIESWEYEAEVFVFEKIKFGTRSYKPDFKVFTKKGVEYHEVKGWMDAKSKTKLKRMAKYYPKIKIILIEGDTYNDLKNKLGKLLKFYT